MRIRNKYADEVLQGGFLSPLYQEINACGVEMCAKN